MLKIIGNVLIGIAAIDFVGSYVGFDFYYDLFGIRLTGAAYTYSPIIVGAIGGVLVGLDNKSDDSESEEETEASEKQPG